MFVHRSHEKREKQKVLCFLFAMLAVFYVVVFNVVFNEVFSASQSTPRSAQMPCAQAL